MQASKPYSRAVSAFLADLHALSDFCLCQCASIESGPSGTQQATARICLVSGGIQTIWAGKVHSVAIDVAILLVHCALRTKLEEFVKKSPWDFDATLQQRFVLASVQAFTKCLAVPGGLQHIGKHPQPAALPNTVGDACSFCVINALVWAVLQVACC